MKRSLGCHSNRGEESPCGTTVTGPRWAAHPFRALRCRSVVWKHEHQITSHLADWYPSITNLIKQILFLKCLFLFSPFLFSCSLTPPLLPSSFIFFPFSHQGLSVPMQGRDCKMAHPIVACHIRYKPLLIRASFISTPLHHETAHTCCIHTFIHTRTWASSCFTVLSKLQTSAYRRGETGLRTIWSD